MIASYSVSLAFSIASCSVENLCTTILCRVKVCCKLLSPFAAEAVHYLHWTEDLVCVQLWIVTDTSKYRWWNIVCLLISSSSNYCFALRVADVQETSDSFGLNSVCDRAGERNIYSQPIYIRSSFNYWTGSKYPSVVLRSRGSPLLYSDIALLNFCTKVS